LYNAFEMVDVRVPAAGTYTVRVTVKRTDEATNYLGLACYVPSR
jgi:hypothetical protein